MNHMATVFPPIGRLKLPFSRGSMMLLMAALNEFILGIDIYLAHQVSGSIIGYEWIPIIFGPVAGVLLLAAGLLARRRRNAASTLATLVLASSIVVGVLGMYFHLQRGGLLLDAGLSVDLLVWAPPILGPAMFAMVGLLGISSAWPENPIGSGTLILPFDKRLKLPYPKTQAYFFIVAMGIIATLISSVLDHARSGFENPWLWLPTAIGIFAIVAAVLLGSYDKPTRVDLTTYAVAMLLMVVIGVVGAVLHVQFDLTAGGVFLVERFIRGAPSMAPLLFANMGTLGLIVLFNPTEGEDDT